MAEKLNNSKDTHIEDVLIESAENYQKIFDVTSSLIIVANKDGEIVDCNIKTEKTIGYSLLELTSSSIDLIIESDFKSIITEYVNLAFNKGLLENEKIRIVKKDGAVLDVIIHASILTHKSGKNKRIIFTLEDITDRIKLDQQILQYQKMQSIGGLAAGIAHDFNNILGTISGAAQQILRKYSTDEKLSHYSSNILKGTESGAELTEKLMNFARKPAVAIEIVDFHEFLIEIITLLKHTVGVNIEILEEFVNGNIYIECDRSQLQNAIINMAVNSKDAMQNGGLLTFKTEVKDSNIILSIIDTGSGMTQSTKDRMFEPFFSTKGNKGTGFGLSSVYGCIKSHNGSLEVDTKLGVGTTIRISLIITNKKTDIVNSKILPVIKEEQINKFLYTIMIVEDEEILLDTYVDIFTDENYLVHSFANPIDALNFYKDNYHKIDIVLSDMMMPKLTGSQLYKELKMINKDLVFLILSGYAPTEDVYSLIKNGVKHLMKPVAFDELFRTIKLLCPYSKNKTLIPIEKEIAELPNQKEINKGNILIVDDESFFAELVSEVVKEKGYSPDVYTSPKECLENIGDHKYKLAIVDFLMPGMTGLELLDKLKRKNPDLKSIILTGISSDKKIKEIAKEIGIEYFLKKPVDLNLLVTLLKKSFSNQIINIETGITKKNISSDINFVGESKKILEIKNILNKLGQSESNIIVFGETGTGKDIVARLLHHNSHRSTKSFIPINCASLPDHLLESELFGHEKGAFTGAIRTKKGLFEWADGGTIFLDEIGDLNYSLQAKLLRTIQEKKIRRVGGSKEISVNVRIISATHRNLEEMILDKSFREDLYYRLNVVKVKMPNLNEREGDISRLVSFFLDKYNETSESSALLNITKEALQLLIDYSWPGNIRELENVINEIAIMCTNKLIEVDDIPEKIKQNKIALKLPVDSTLNMNLYVDNAKREYVTTLLTQNNGNVATCASLAGINRASFHRILQNLSVDPKQFRS